MTAKRATTKKRPKRRDAEQTKARLLAAAVREFATHGFSGARIERIVKAARSNMKLLYEHYGDKDGLYLAVLESVYAKLRESESRLQLSSRDPVEALKALVEFTYDHFRENHDFVRLTSGENLLRGRYIRASKKIPALSSPLISALDGVLKRGIASGDFRRSADALQIYVSVVALSCHHLNNRYTLSAAFGTDLADPRWLDKRRTHIVEIVSGYVCAGARNSL